MLYLFNNVNCLKSVDSNDSPISLQNFTAWCIYLTRTLNYFSTSLRYLATDNSKNTQQFVKFFKIEYS